MNFNKASQSCYNISSNFDSQGAVSKVKVTVAIFRKNFVIAVAPSFIDEF